MKNYFMLDGEQIPMSNETAKSLREKQTYKIGNCFRMGNSGGTVVMLVRCGKEVVAAVIKNAELGNHWTYPKTVRNDHAITQKELNILLGSYQGVLVNIKIEETD